MSMVVRLTLTIWAVGMLWLCVLSFRGAIQRRQPEAHDVLLLIASIGAVGVLVGAWLA